MVNKCWFIIASLSGRLLLAKRGCTTQPPGKLVGKLSLSHLAHENGRRNLSYVMFHAYFTTGSKLINSPKMLGPDE